MLRQCTKLYTALPCCPLIIAMILAAFGLSGCLRSVTQAQRKIPVDFDYAAVKHIRPEAQEKLARIRPASLGQASRISGVTPADLAVLMVHLEHSKPEGAPSAEQ